MLLKWPTTTDYATRTLVNVPKRLYLPWQNTIPPMLWSCWCYHPKKGLRVTIPWVKRVYLLTKCWKSNAHHMQQYQPKMTGDAGKQLTAWRRWLPWASSRARRQGVVARRSRSACACTGCCPQNGSCQGSPVYTGECDQEIQKRNLSRNVLKWLSSSKSALKSELWFLSDDSDSIEKAKAIVH